MKGSGTTDNARRPPAAAFRSNLFPEAFRTGNVSEDTPVIG
jgi:hypothetical protein